jgi:hypothetical protein
MSGTYAPAGLKTAFIPKENSDKERMICIPCVADRVVQRAMVRYLVLNRKLPIYNSSSFGFIDGLGTGAAIRRAVELRNRFDWCLKTDIESFFDSIQRPYLKECVSRALGNHSFVPIISKIIDCEIKLTERNRDKVKNQGIKPGRGIRQGMPMSPILANLVLSKFDREIEKNKIDMVRYADDLLLFFSDRQAAKSGHRLVIELLEELDLRIPEIADGSKTRMVGPREPVPFLGRSIAYVESAGGYVAGVSARQIDKLKNKIREEYSLDKRMKAESTLQETVVDLSQTVAAYLGIYKDAYNFPKFEEEMRAVTRVVISEMFGGIFGRNAISGLASHQKKFLGFGQLEMLKPVNDIGA